ncbi:MAG: MFS transporter [Micrococcales bacterium 73-13]|nr:MAG: MFS transporter [Micrococcales bacterium 73-13]
MFRSLGRFNYRLWFFGSLVSNVGSWAQSTALSWTVLTFLTDDDPAAMGVCMALQFGPPLLLVGITGWVADRFPRRRILLVTQAALGSTALTVGVLLLSGVLTLPLMYALALLFGIATAFDNPTRQAFVSDLVGRADASNAVALNSAAFNTARLIGPAVAGFAIVAVGSGWVFIADAVSYLATIIVLLAMRRGELVPRAKATGVQRFLDGFRYVRRRGDLVALFAMAFIIGAFGMNFPIFASTMSLEFGHDADGFGLLSSMLAIGSLAGALLAARRAQARLRVAIATSLLFGISCGASAFMPGFWSYAAVCVITGFSVVTMLTTANGYVQTTAEPVLRGRVLAIYMALMMGGTVIGAPIVGWVAAVAGPRAAILVGGASGVVAFLIGVSWFLLSGRVRRSADARLGIEVVETRPIDLVVAPEEFSDAVLGATPIREEPEDDLPEEPEGAVAVRPT